MTKFKAGDKVNIKSYGKSGEILNVWPHSSGMDQEYNVKYDNPSTVNGYGLALVTESDLEFTNEDAKPIVNRVVTFECSCGSRFSSFPQIHSDWCDKYRSASTSQYYDYDGGD